MVQNFFQKEVFVVLSLIISIFICMVLISICIIFFVSKIKETKAEYSSEELITCATIYEGIKLVGYVITALSLSAIIACMLCHPAAELESVTTEKAEIQAIIQDIESDGGTMPTLEKGNFVERISTCNDDIEYLQTHYDSKWNGIFIPDEAKDLTKIEIPEFLKNFV